jgi:hypothetical protein
MDAFHVSEEHFDLLSFTPRLLVGRHCRDASRRLRSTCWHRHVDHVGHEASQKNTSVTDNPMSYVGYGFPLDVISYAVWL